MRTKVYTRFVSATLVATVGMGALVACSTQDTSTDTSQTQASASTGKKISTLFGEMAPLEKVERVVVLEGRRDLDIALSLGLPVVGYPALEEGSIELDIPTAYALSEAQEQHAAQELFLEDEINIEAIIKAQPDLIISRASDAEPILKELQAIAPVVAVGEQGSTTWQEDLKTVSEMTGTQDRAHKIIEDYNQRVDNLKSTYAKQLAQNSFAAAKIDDEAVEVRPQRLLSAILQDVGASPSQAFKQAIDEGKAEFSPEQTVSALEDVDALIVHSNSAQAWKKVQESPLYQQLPAVKSGHVVRSDKMTFEGGPFAAERALTAIEELLKTL